MSKKKKPVSKETQATIDEFFKGDKILDETAFKKAVEGLREEDQQLLRDLRESAFEHDEEDEPRTDPRGTLPERPVEDSAEPPGG